MEREYSEAEENDTEYTKEMIDKMLEEAENAENEMTPESLKSSIESCQEKLKLNLSLRDKYQKQPDKYVESEVDLHEEIKVLQRIAAYPNLIDVLLENNGIELLIRLIQHENVDIVDDAVNIIDEITDADFLQEVENPKLLLEEFIGNNIFAILVKNLYRLDETNEETQVVSDILSIFENFLDIYPFASKLIGDRTKLINWLVTRIRRTGVVDQVKLFSSELLDTLLQTTTENQIRFAKLEGIPHLLKVVLENKDTKLNGGDEEEFLCNIINSICSSLLIKENQDIFMKSDGINIILMMLRENNLQRHLVVKVLDFALQNNPEACREFVESEGLGPLFSYYMAKGFKNKPKLKSYIDQGEGYCIGVIISLAKHLKSVARDRLIYKFKENKQEKCERLIELYTSYIKKINNNNDNTIDPDTMTELKFRLQSLSLLIGHLYTLGDESIKDKLDKLFAMNDIKRNTIKANLEHMSSLLGEEFDGDSNYFSNKRFVQNIINLMP